MVTLSPSCVFSCLLNVRSLLDGGHLKGPWKGVSLVATGKDTDNKLVLLAFVICYKENAFNYRFLLSEMKKNPLMNDVLQSSTTVIYSDEHLGISSAIKAKAAAVTQRCCAAHLAKNFPGPGIGSVRSV